MKLRTWTRLSTDELKRRRAALKLILIVQAAGLVVGGVASTLAWLASPTSSGLPATFLPFILVSVCWLVYRWSERHWYPAVHVYLLATLALNFSGLYSLGGTQSPMVGFFAFIFFAAAMLVDLRAGVEWTVLSLVVYGMFAAGVVKPPMAAFETTKLYTVPAFSMLGMLVLSLLIQLFGRSLNQALDQSRRLADDLEQAAQALSEKNRQAEEANRQLQALAAVQQRRATQLQAVADVSAATTALRASAAQATDAGELLPRVVTAIQQRFDFYYVGVFLLDDAGEYAELRAGTGEPGRIMQERGHRLELGGQSMVGWVCANQQARIALDAPLEGVLGIGQDAVRFAPGTAQGFANPLLPDTRSEVALPLRTGDHVVGALDIQSAQSMAFDQNDVAVLQGMADQIAIALENARLFQQTQQALKERDEFNRLLAGQGWQDYLTQTQAVRTAEFELAGGTTGPASSRDASVLRVPLELRGQSIGTLVMERGAGSPAWSQEEAETIRAIAQQATLTLETARLFEDAQRTAARERLLNEITARIRAATTLEGVLNSAVREISQVTGANYAAIDLELEEAH